MVIEGYCALAYPLIPFLLRGAGGYIWNVWTRNRTIWYGVWLLSYRYRRLACSCLASCRIVAANTSGKISNRLDNTTSSGAIYNTTNRTARTGDFTILAQRVGHHPTISWGCRCEDTRKNVLSCCRNNPTTTRTTTHDATQEKPFWAL